MDGLTDCLTHMTNSLARQRIELVARLAWFVLMVYVFLVAIKLFGISAKIVGADTARSLFSGLENPFAGLAVGILATVLMQSSSATTSLAVILVGGGELTVAQAVPVVMGANVGTSITNTLVSLGHISQGEAFRRAFAGATVHDIFNLLTVAILLPVELLTRRLCGVGYLQGAATWLVDFLHLQGRGGKFHSPINTAVEWLAEWIKACFSNLLDLEWAQTFYQDFLHMKKEPLLGGILLVIAIAALIFALIAITKNMRILMANRIEVWLNQVLTRSGLLGLAIGAIITAIVQSSSITTSLLIPMFGAGVLKIEAGFPIMVGANIGTTVTAMLAAMVAGGNGLIIAFVHLLFNVSGTVIFFPFPPMRRIPIILAQKLADLTIRNRVWVLIYVFGVFFVIPILGIVIWK